MTRLEHILLTALIALGVYVWQLQAASWSAEAALLNHLAYCPYGERYHPTPANPNPAGNDKE